MNCDIIIINGVAYNSTPIHYYTCKDKESWGHISQEGEVYLEYPEVKQVEIPVDFFHIEDDDDEIIDYTVWGRLVRASPPKSLSFSRERKKNKKK